MLRRNDKKLIFYEFIKNLVLVKSDNAKLYNDPDLLFELENFFVDGRNSFC